MTGGVGLPPHDACMCWDDVENKNDADDESDGGHGVVVLVLGCGGCDGNGPMSSDLGTNTPVEARFWHWLEQFSVRQSLKSFKFSPSRSEAGCELA